MQSLCKEQVPSEWIRTDGHRSRPEDQILGIAI